MALPERVKFPDVLYVHQTFAGLNEAPFEGYLEFETAEDGDIVGVYKLEKVYIVKEKTEKYLSDSLTK